MKRSHRRLRALRRVSGTLAMMGLLTIVGGCGERFRVADVAGTVTYRGQPVPGLMVQFQHRDGLRDHLPVATGFTDEQGRYRLERAGGKTGAVVGPNTATVTSFSEEGGTKIKLPPDLGAKTFAFEVAASGNVCDIDIGAD